MAHVAVHRSLATALAVMVAFAAACSGDDDDASVATSTSDAAETVASPASQSSVVASRPVPTAGVSDPVATAGSAPPPTAPPPTAAPADTGVPGLDSEDAFCSAWSRFGGSWQLLVQAGAASDPAQVARLEVIASTVVQDAYDDLFAVWPAELETERELVADAYFGAFLRRSADAAAALANAGATPDETATLAQAWDSALAAYDPSTAVDVAVPTELASLVDEAATAFGAARVPLQADPSMVITAETPLTDAFLATACPDQGWIVGQDVVDDAG
jgi:hypothetical protein